MFYECDADVLWKEVQNWVTDVKMLTKIFPSLLIILLFYRKTTVLARRQTVHLWNNGLTAAD